MTAGSNSVIEFVRAKRLTFQLLLLWASWMILGGVFYTKKLEVSWGRGFYHAVSVGYSIGWGDVSEDFEDSQQFSIFYLCCGASFVGVAFGAFGNFISRERDNWYENELQRITLKEYRSKNFFQYLYYWAYVNREVLLVVIVWLGFVFIGAGMAHHFHADDGWNFTNSMYFATSSLSTGGLYAIENAEEWEYALIAAYCAIGIPIMGAAMAGLASLFLDLGSVEQACKDIRTPITEEEIRMLKELGVAPDCDTVHLGKLDFLVLCIVRIGVVHPDLVKFIFQYFSELDSDDNGKLSVEELALKLKVVQKEMSDRLLLALAREHSQRTISSNTFVSSEFIKKVQSISAFKMGSSKKIKSQASDISALTVNSGHGDGTLHGKPGSISPSIKLKDVGKVIPHTESIDINFVASARAAEMYEREGDRDWRHCSPMDLKL